MRWPRRREEAVVETYVVQLHRAVKHPTVRNAVTVLSSWSPIEAHSVEEARDVAARLRRDNRWGGAVEFPHVTITGPGGENIWERGTTPPAEEADR